MHRFVHTFLIWLRSHLSPSGDTLRTLLDTESGGT
jgi:hypothetical protein